jgi:hypothetical protein
VPVPSNSPNVIVTQPSEPAPQPATSTRINNAPIGGTRDTNRSSSNRSSSNHSDTMQSR